MHNGNVELIAEFVKQLGHYFFSFWSLHTEAHRPGESGAMAGHIDFGDEQDVPRAAKREEPVQFFIRVIFAGIALHVFRPGELWVFRGGDAPGDIFRQVQVKNVDFVSGKHVHLLDERVQVLKIPADVLHKATPGKRGPVAYQAGRYAYSVAGELPQGLEPVKDSVLGIGPYKNGVTVHLKGVRLRIGMAGPGGVYGELKEGRGYAFRLLLDGNGCGPPFQDLHGLLREYAGIYADRGGLEQGKRGLFPGNFPGQGQQGWFGAGKPIQMVKNERFPV